MGRNYSGCIARSIMFGVVPRIFFNNPKETLTGIVQDLPASDIEERSARAIDKLPEWSYHFRLRIDPITGQLSSNFTNLSGEVEIDFVAVRGSEVRSVLVDGEISHFMSLWQRVQDEEKTEKVNAYMRQIGQGDAVRVPFWKLDTQQNSDRYYRQLLI